MAVNYEMRLKLTKFIDSRIIENEDSNGVYERGVFIPIDKNCLYETEQGDILLSAFVTENMIMPNSNRQPVSHIVKQKISKNHLQKLKDLGYKGSLLLGTMWVQNKTYMPYQQTSGQRVKIEED
jgi:hypothetical protein